MVTSVPPTRPARPPVITAKSPSGLASLEPVAATKPPATRASQQTEATSTPRDVSTAPRRARLLAWGSAGACVAVLGAALATRIGGWSREMDSSVSPRIVSGTPEKKRTKSGKLERWRQPEATVYIDSSVDALGPHARKAVRAAFETWQDSGADLPSLVFRSAEHTSTEMVQDGKSTVTLAPIDIKGHHRDLAVTVSYADERSGAIVEADIIISSNHPFAVMAPRHRPVEPTTHSDREADERPGSRNSQPSPDWQASSSCSSEDSSHHRECGAQYDLQNVIAHEAGHFFGLGEDETDPTTTMFHCTSPCETHKRSLEPSDVTTMAEVYSDGYEAEEDVPSGGVGCSGARIAGSPPSPSAPKALALLGLLGAALARSRRKR